jgi:low temperature requirement protein LtrA
MIDRERPDPDPPLRVSTIELFFDLIFVFTITQLTSVLGEHVTPASAGRVLLIFGLLWWMYSGYVWLTNTRTPSRVPERLLILLAMVGFLIVGLSIPHAFGADGERGRDGLAFGLGYLLVVAVHGGLWLRVNRNFWRILPYNVGSALLLVIAGLTPSPAAYALWGTALAIQVFAALFVRLGGRFEIQTEHFVERHGGLLIIALGESVADVGIGTAGHRVTVSLALSAALGLALTAALWWSFFGTGDDGRAARSLAGADPTERPRLVLIGYFYAYIPMLLGIVAIAAGLKTAIGHPGATLTAGPAVALAGGVTLFLAGDVMFRRVLRTGIPSYRAAAAAAALVAWPVAMSVDAAAGIALLTAMVAAALAAEHVTVKS